MTKIIYRIGDATNPQSPKEKVIAHVCNNVRKWGAGFVLALSKKWDEPERDYRERNNLSLGNVSFVSVENDITVANMIAQEGVASNYFDLHKSPIRYDALIDCLIKVNDYCSQQDATLHLPRIGSGLAGGKWNIIETLIEDYINVPICVYDLKPMEGYDYEEA